MNELKTSESTTEISKALQKFSFSVSSIKKNADNPFFKSRYATLDNIIETITPQLQENDLVITQFPIGESGLLTRLIHTNSGEWMEASFSMPLAKQDPQVVGSAITYARRYAIQSILFLNIEDDDDGNKASEPPKTPVKDDDNRPWLSEQAFNKIVERMQDGEKDLFEKTKASFRMKKTYREQLEKLSK